MKNKFKKGSLVKFHGHIARVLDVSPNKKEAWLGVSTKMSQLKALKLKKVV